MANVLLQGDTIENVANELDCIMRTGHYINQYKEGEIGTKGKMLLEFDVTTSLQATQEDLDTPRKEKWTSQQISDFVRKLGFMDKDRDSEKGRLIIHFLHTNQVS